MAGQPVQAAANGEQMKSERARFVALAFCWADIVLEIDADEKVVYAGGAIRPLLARSQQDVVGGEVKDLVAPADLGLFRSLMGVARRQGRIENQFVRLRREKGNTTPFAVSGYQMPEMDGHYFFALRMGTRAEKLTAAGAKLKKDEASGLYDADSFAELMGQQVRGGTLPPDSKMTLISVAGLTDLTGKLGESKGEDLLNSVSAALRANSVDGDAASRIDNDKFGLVHGAELDIADLESQIARFAREMDPAGEGIAVESATVAVDATVTSGEDLANGLIYSINKFKHARGGSFDLKSLSTSLSGLVSEAAASVAGFKRVVSGREFGVAFHPILDTRTGEIHHYEALVRFDSQEKGQSPYEHIVFAEETGLISEFDLAMAEKCIQWLAGQPKKYKIAVNISGNSVGNMGYITGLQNLLRGNTWLHERIMFEITESARMDDLSAANAFIQGLRTDGYEVCLDDFGAGAANFQYLSTLEVDVVKIDGPAVKNAEAARKGRAFLRALCNLCRELRVDTIAEMVDTEDTLKFVRDCGVNHVQGYLFGKPSTNIKVFEETLSNRNFKDMFS